ncbi:TatD family hydrolase, partial [Chloroflexota bacterium]
EAEAVTQNDISSLEKLAENFRVVAVGELGLDYHYQPVNREEQIKVMRWQLEMAQRLDLPLVIHCRDAEEDMLKILTEWISAYRKGNDNPIGVLHCFSGDLETANKYLELGFYISVGAYIGYPSSKQLHNAIRAIPLDRLMLETDSPFLPPQPYRGQRNEPSYIPSVLETLADITGVEKEIIARETTQNAERLFQLP